MGFPELFIKKGNNNSWYVCLSWDNKFYSAYNQPHRTYNQAKNAYLSTYKDIFIRQLWRPEIFNKSWRGWILGYAHEQANLCRILGLPNEQIS